MSSVIEILKELREEYIGCKNGVKQYGDEYYALSKAIVALEQKERLEKWLNERIVESEKYPDTQEPAYYYRKVLELMK